MLSIKSLTMIYATLLMAGCADPLVPSEGPLFCDVEQVRIFPSQEVIDYRLRRDKENFKLDLKTNETGARSCMWTNES